mgnify:CR=1 FL=1
MSLIQFWRTHAGEGASLLLRHVFLVGVSTTAAVLIGVPVGILASRRPRLRYVVGRNAKLLFSLRRHIPGEIFERIYWGIAQRVVTKVAAKEKSSRT